MQEKSIFVNNYNKKWLHWMDLWNNAENKTVPLVPTSYVGDPKHINLIHFFKFYYYYLGNEMFL